MLRAAAKAVVPQTSQTESSPPMAMPAASPERENLADAAAQALGGLRRRDEVDMVGHNTNGH